LISLVTLAYFLGFHHKALFGKIDERLSTVKEVSFAMYMPAVLLAVIAVLAGLFFSSFVELFIQPAADVLGRGILG
jgi:NADH:ubiquinone oxidoreductase subunit 5 (subunit L)/multisubunit Na+/H+ antiporter MnhA subunit